MVAQVGLDGAELASWCRGRLGAEPERILFESGYLSRVVGLRLTSGVEVVVKARPWQDRLVGCAQAQQILFTAGFPAPEVLVPPERVRQLGISAETFVPGGGLLPAAPDSAARFAGVLAALVRSAPDPAEVGPLTPAPAWVGWDHPDPQLWPDPDDRSGDLNTIHDHGWLDELGAAVRASLRSLAGPTVIGHGDWYSQNLRWTGRALLVVHDWDSLVAQPEPAIAGAAAAIWPGTGQPGEVATVAQSEAFLVAYEHARGAAFTEREASDAWAAGLWTRAFDAKKAALAGADPSLALTRAEAEQRRRLAGL